jgi:FMN phosphatase YigB (HAD superfamily)
LYENAGQVSIVTNCNKVVAEAVLKRLGIRSYVNYVIASEDVSHGKPNSEPYIHAMQLYGIDISLSQCIVFEDSKAGIMSAANAGIPVIIGIESVYSRRELLNIHPRVCDTIASFNSIDWYSIIGWIRSHHTRLDSSIIDREPMVPYRTLLPLKEFACKAGALSAAKGP